MRLLVLLLIVQSSVASADPTVLAGTPREQAMRLYAQATKMFEDQDFVAAAVTFGQCAQLLGRVDRDASGVVTDKDAHSFLDAALSNKATAYSRAGLYVEAAAAFGELRERFGPELAEKDRAEIDDAIARIEERIGTVVVKGIPADGAEVRLDGRFERRPLDKPLRMSEGSHSIDVTAKGYKPYVAEITVTGKQEVIHDVVLVPLDTPSKLRVESTVGRTTVAIDGVERGTAPVEVTLKPGPHRVGVSSESYLDSTNDVVLAPGERTVVRVSMIHAHAPLGLRIMPGFLATFPGRTDTPFGVWSQTLSLALFHDVVRVRSVRFGLELTYTPRTLDSATTGIIGMWCPDKTTWERITWCPVTLVASYGFGGSEPPFDSGIARARGVTALEVRRGAGFVRGGIGLTLQDYARDRANLDGTTTRGFLMLWSGTYELSAGIDL